MRNAFLLSVAVFLSSGVAHADFTHEVFLEDHRLRHDAQAALGYEELEELIDEPDLRLRARFARQLRRQDLDLGAALKASRERVRRALVEVAEGRRQPSRPYNSSRFDGRVIRDTLLKADRRGNVGAVLGGFRRYDEDDQARIEELHALAGEGVVEAICEDAATWAGYQNVRLLAGEVATALDTHRIPTSEIMEAQGDRAFADALERARRELAAVVRARGRPLPGFLTIGPELDHGLDVAGGQYVAELSGAPSSFLVAPQHSSQAGSGIFGLPDA